jgi:hypothetical protein
VNESLGWYSLVQYCPDAGRLEAVNVGVLLFCSDPYVLDVRLADTNERVRRFFGSQDWALVDMSKEAVVERLALGRENGWQLEQVEDYVARGANLIQFTKLRETMVTEPQRDLDELFATLVAEAAYASAVPAARALAEE